MSNIVPHMAYYSFSSNKSDETVCFTFDPIGVSPAGYKGRVRKSATSCWFNASPLETLLQVNIWLNITAVSQVDVYFHNRGQLFVPNRNEGFGSTLKYFYNFHLNGTKPHKQFHTHIQMMATDVKYILLSTTQNSTPWFSGAIAGQAERALQPIGQGWREQARRVHDKVHRGSSEVQVQKRGTKYEECPSIINPYLELT